MAAALGRWQDGVRAEMRRRLREAGVEGVGFVEDHGAEGEDEGEEDGIMAEDGQEEVEMKSGNRNGNGNGNGNGDCAMEEAKE